MELARVHDGDVVRCDVRGLVFMAFVRGHDDDGLQITVLERHKLPRGLPITHVTAQQVLATWWGPVGQAPRASRRREDARARERLAVPA